MSTLPEVLQSEYKNFTGAVKLALHTEGEVCTNLEAPRWLLDSIPVITDALSEYYLTENSHPYKGLAKKAIDDLRAYSRSQVFRRRTRLQMYSGNKVHSLIGESAKAAKFDILTDLST